MGTDGQVAGNADTGQNGTADQATTTLGTNTKTKSPTCNSWLLVYTMTYVHNKTSS